MGPTKQLLVATTILIVCLCGCVPSITCADDYTPDEQELIDELLILNHKRELPFGNMHAIWTKNEVNDGQSTESNVEFWSRENQYFRYDETMVQDGFKVERHFVIPSRFAHFTSFNPDVRGAITDHGSAAEGRQAIRNAGWFCEANKRLLDPMDDLIECWRTAKGVTVQIRKETNGQLVIIAKTTGEGEVDGQYLNFKNSEVLKFSPGDYRFLESKFRVDVSDGSWSEDVSIKTYDQTLSGPAADVPVRSTFDDVESDGSTHGVYYTLQEIQFDPAPMEVFELPEFTVSTTSKWTRRLVLLLSGAALIGIFFFVRRRMTKQIA